MRKLLHGNVVNPCRLLAWINVITVTKSNDLVCYPFRAPECIKLNAAIFRFTLVLSDLNVFT